MKLSTQKEIDKIAVEQYKALASSLYSQYKDIPADEIRVEILRALTNHILSKTVERLQRKVRKVAKVKKENFEDMFEKIPSNISA